MDWSDGELTRSTVRPWETVDADLVRQRESAALDTSRELNGGEAASNQDPLRRRRTNRSGESGPDAGGISSTNDTRGIDPAPSNAASEARRQTNRRNVSNLRRRASIVMETDLAFEEHVSAIPSVRDADTDNSDPWHTIQTAMAVNSGSGARARTSRGANPDRSRTATDSPTYTMWMERERRRRLRQYMSALTDGDRIGRSNGEPNPRFDEDARLGTAGCAMSEDGSIL